MNEKRFLPLLEQAPTRRTAMLTGLAMFCTGCAEVITRETVDGSDDALVTGDDAAQTDDVIVTGDDVVTPPDDVVTPPDDVVGPRPDVVTPPPDVVTPPPDVVTPPPDVMMSVTCPTGLTAAGHVSDYTVGGTPRLFSGGPFFVLRDAMGFYAVTAVCTHNGCTVGVSGSGYHCPCHGATFARDGTAPTSPARSPLRNWAVCIASDGSVFVNARTAVAVGTRTTPP